MASSRASAVSKSGTRPRAYSRRPGASRRSPGSGAVPAANEGGAAAGAGMLGAEGLDEDAAGDGVEGLAKREAACLDEDAAEEEVEGLAGREAAWGAARSVSRLRLAPWQHHARSSRGRRTQAVAGSMGLGRGGQRMTPKSPRP